MQNFRFYSALMNNPEHISHHWIDKICLLCEKQHRKIWTLPFQRTERHSFYAQIALHVGAPGGGFILLLHINIWGLKSSLCSSLVLNRHATLTKTTMTKTAVLCKVWFGVQKLWVCQLIQLRWFDVLKVTQWLKKRTWLNVLVLRFSVVM